MMPDSDVDWPGIDSSTWASTVESNVSADASITDSPPGSSVHSAACCT